MYVHIYPSSFPVFTCPYKWKINRRVYAFLRRVNVIINFLSDCCSVPCEPGLAWRTYVYLVTVNFFYHDVGGHRNLRSAAYRYWFNFNYISPAILILLGSMVYRQAGVWKFRLACKTLSYRVYLWAGIAVIIAGRRLYGNTYLSSILIQPFLSYLHLITVYLGSAPANSFYFHFIFTPCSCYIDRLGLSINPFVPLSLSLYIICS